MNFVLPASRAGEKIDGYLPCSAKFEQLLKPSSSSPEPMTQSLPVTAGRRGAARARRERSRNISSPRPRRRRSLRADRLTVTQAVQPWSALDDLRLRELPCGLRAPAHEHLVGVVTVVVMVVMLVVVAAGALLAVLVVMVLMLVLVLVVVMLMVVAAAALVLVLLLPRPLRRGARARP